MLNALKLLATTFLILFIVIVVTLKWIFWEPVDVERGSWVYHLMIPDYAKKYPIWDAVSVPLYDVSIPDGLAKGVIGVHYRSEANGVALISKLKTKGFGCWAHKRGGNYSCSKTTGVEESIEISIKPSDNVGQIKIYVNLIGH